jgi:glycosyltransferase involved in cell wall biosynthesis
MKVLYATHTSRISGAERSLLDLLALLPRGIEPTVACPPGPLAERVRAVGIPVVRLPEIGGLGRGRAVAALEIARAGLALRRRAALTRTDLVHAASLRAGLATVVATRLGGPPSVVDVRDCLGPDGAAGSAQRLVARNGCTVIANSQHTAASFRAATGVSPRIVHPLVDLDPFLHPRLGREETRRRLGLPARAPVLAVVGQLTPWKAQDDAVRMLRILRTTFPDATLLIAGDVKFDGATRHDNHAYERSLRMLAAPLGGAVHFLGERGEVNDILPALDILLVPSWEEPFGRVVLEGMAAGIAVIATTIGGPKEILRDGVEGVLLPPRRPDRWTTEVSALLHDDERRSRIAVAARERALRFQHEREHRLAAVLEMYREPLGELTAVEASVLV